MDQKDRERSLELALGEIEKAHGKGSILRLGSRDVVPVSTIPTGSISVDAALGVGGLPRGRVVEIFGPESSGKTTLALSALAQAQKLDVKAVVGEGKRQRRTLARSYDPTPAMAAPLRAARRVMANPLFPVSFAASFFLVMSLAPSCPYLS